MRRAGLVFTLTNMKTFLIGNYIDNCFIELSNEHDNDPNFAAEYTFGGISITGNIFMASNVAPWFRWLVITPRGTGHSLNGYTVANNTFRVVGSIIDRVEMVDTTFATLSFISFRNVTFEGNTFNAVTQVTSSPVLVQHTQNTEADTWMVDASAYLPFQSRARNVTGLVAEGAISNTATVAQYVTPYVQVEQGAQGNLVNLKWPSQVKGVMQVTIRCDNPV